MEEHDALLVKIEEAITRFIEENKYDDSVNVMWRVDSYDANAAEIMMMLDGLPLSLGMIHRLLVAVFSAERVSGVCIERVDNPDNADAPGVLACRITLVAAGDTPRVCDLLVNQKPSRSLAMAIARQKGGVLPATKASMSASVAALAMSVDSAAMQIKIMPSKIVVANVSKLEAQIVAYLMQRECAVEICDDALSLTWPVAEPSAPAPVTKKRPLPTRLTHVQKEEDEQKREEDNEEPEEQETQEAPPAKRSAGVLSRLASKIGLF